jgi:hypothetical protein
MGSTVTKWEHAMVVGGLDADTKEVVSVGVSRYTERYRVVRVRLEGEHGIAGELLVPVHDAPQIGDMFNVTFERLSP